MSQGNHSTWHELVGLARPLVADPEKGANRIKAFCSWADDSLKPHAQDADFKKALAAIVKLTSSRILRA